MSDTVAIVAPKDITETKALAKDLAMSALMPAALRKKPEDVMATVLAGAELGLPPMTAIRGINIINGSISLKADLMGALVKSKRDVCEFLQLVESTPTRATYRTKRAGNPDPTTMTYTMEDAQAAGLASNPNYKKHPAAMLRARCLSAICRAEYPDLCMGLYDSDSAEIEEVVERDVTPQAAHVDSVKEQLRASLTQVEDAVIVAEPQPDPVTLMTERINAANTAEELTALLPDLKALPEDIRKALHPVYLARKAAL